jgi:hypothetical protein
VPARFTSTHVRRREKPVRSFENWRERRNDTFTLCLLEVDFYNDVVAADIQIDCPWHGTLTTKRTTIRSLQEEGLQHACPGSVLMLPGHHVKGSLEVTRPDWSNPIMRPSTTGVRGHGARQCGHPFVEIRRTSNPEPLATSADLELTVSTSTVAVCGPRWTSIRT